MYCRGSFKKIVKRGRKLMVEKFEGGEGGITSLVPTLQQVPRGRGGGGGRARF